MEADPPVRIYAPHKVNLNPLAAPAWTRNDNPPVTSVSLDNKNLSPGPA